MGEELRVTMVATGLGSPVARSQPKPVILKTGTDDFAHTQADYQSMDAEPAVFRNNRREAQVEAMKQSGMELLDIPAFLRKQAD